MASVWKRGGKGARGKIWNITYKDHLDKVRQKSSGTTDKAAAQRIANKLEADAALRREGVIDVRAESIQQHAARRIADHLKDYEAKLRAGSNSDKYVSETLEYVREICETAGAETAGDIDSDGVNRFAEKLRDSGKSARTRQAYLTAIKDFTRWLAAEQKLPRDPLVGVRKPDPKSDPRHERRMLLPAEWPWVEAVAQAGPVRNGMGGPERAILYATAIQTGLRANELSSLRRGSLFLDGDQPFITCKAGSTKNRKLAKQYIAAGLAAELRHHVATRTPQAAVFGIRDKTKLAKMIRGDLLTARQKWLRAAKHDPEEHLKREQSDFLAYENHAGEKLVFHSLRHTTGAWMALAGEHPKVIQAVMRHSTITLTMDAYGHLFPGSEADAVRRLDDFMGVPAERAMLATGTEPSPGGAENMQRTGRESSQQAAIGRNEAAGTPESVVPLIPLPAADLGDNIQPSAVPCSITAPLAQLAEQLTLNQ